MSKKKRKTTGEYLSSAKELKTFIPSLSKYRRRKTLTRWEKSAITRAGKKIAVAGGVTAFAPLTKMAAKRLKTKNAIFGNGIRAIRLRNIITSSHTTVGKDGELTISKDGRVFHTVTLPTDLQSFIDAGEELIATRTTRRREIFFWTVKGRAGHGMFTISEIIELLVKKYFFAYKEVDAWLLGYVYHDVQ